MFFVSGQFRPVERFMGCCCCCLDGQPRNNFFFFSRASSRVSAAAALPAFHAGVDDLLSAIYELDRPSCFLRSQQQQFHERNNKKKKKKMTTVVQQQLLGKSRSPFGRLLRLEEEAAAFGGKKK